MRTSRAFDIQEKRGSAVNSPPNIQRSGSLLDKHSSSESDLEPTETSWKSHKIFFHHSDIVQFWFSLHMEPRFVSFLILPGCVGPSLRSCWYRPLHAV